MEDNLISLFTGLGFLGIVAALGNRMQENFENTQQGPTSDRALAWQLYQQAIHAGTPTPNQLNNISGQSYMQTGNNSEVQGGVSQDYAPYANLQDNEYQAVNMHNPRADSISACMQNTAPTRFLASSLLPRQDAPSQGWDELNIPQDILAGQNFLAPSQQFGIDTISSSNKNPSYDLRPTIPNPMGSGPLIYQSSIMPDLERKNVFDNGVQGGLYGTQPAQSYVGMHSSNF